MIKLTNYLCQFTNFVMRLKGNNSVNVMTICSGERLIKIYLQTIFIISLLRSFAYNRFCFYYNIFTPLELSFQ